jgi:hypothetical protein
MQYNISTNGYQWGIKIAARTYGNIYAEAMNLKE